MAQISKYTNQAAYTADNTRLSTKSAVSLIADENKSVYDGVNCIAPLSAGERGDLLVYDSVDSTHKLIKAATAKKAQLAANLTPEGVVYGRKGNKLQIVSLTEPGTSVQWAYGYEVQLTGFTLSAGGTFILVINGTSVSTTYSAGASLADIVALINANTAFTSKGWHAVATGVAIIMTCNYSSCSISVTSGCTLTRRQVDKNYQTEFVGDLPNGSAIDYVRQKNKYASYWGIMQIERAYTYYSTHGSASTNVPLGSSDVVSESVFNATDNPILYAAYNGDYKAYLWGEHSCQFPSAFQTMLRDGKENTKILAAHKFIDIYGVEQNAYPAAAMAYAFSCGEIATNSWWLPSSEEMFTLIKDSLVANTDALQKTLAAFGTALVLTNYYWTSCEYSSDRSFFYYGDNGALYGGTKCDSDRVRPVSALSII